MTQPSTLSKTSELLGKSLGSWILEKHLGEGGMAIVYRARHEFLPKQAAIKVLRPELSREREKLERFQREAIAVNELRHKSIVELIDFGYAPKHDCYYMVQEFLDGCDLEAKTGDAPFSLRFVENVMGQICSALATVHRAGLIHRDLKPSNIFLLDGGVDSCRVKVLDFGIAKLQEGPLQGADSLREQATTEQEMRQILKKSLTREATIIGTPTHIAPEQIHQRYELTAQTDVYSLGVILYEMLTGQLPLLKESHMDQFVAIVTEEPPLIGQYVPAFRGSRLEDLVARMLMKQPERRPAGVETVWDELRQALVLLGDLHGTASYAQAKELLGDTTDESESLPGALTGSDSFGGGHSILPTGEGALRGSRRDTSMFNDEEVERRSKELKASQKSGFSLGILVGVALVVLILGGVTLALRPLLFQDSKEPKVVQKETESERFQRLMRVGNDAFAKNRFAKAAEAWKKATQLPTWRKSSSFPALYQGIGQALARQNQVNAALRYYEKYVSEAQQKKDKASVEQRQKALQRVVQLKSEVQNRRATAVGLLGRIEKKIQAKDWPAVVSLRGAILEKAPSIPEIHQKLAESLGWFAPESSAQVFRRALKTIDMSASMRKQVLAAYQKIRVKVVEETRRILGLFQKIRGFLVEKKTREALQLLRRMDEKDWVFRVLHKEWRALVRERAERNLKQAIAILRLYRDKRKKFSKEKLDVWVPASAKMMPLPRLQKQLRLLEKLSVALAPLTRARRDLDAGRFGPAQRGFQQFLRAAKSMQRGDSWGFTKSLGKDVQEAEMFAKQLGAMLSWKRKGDALFQQARFLESLKAYSQIFSSLEDSRRLQGLQKRLQKKRQEALKMQDMLKQAYRWMRMRRRSKYRKAEKVYLLYLRKFPRAYNRKQVSKLLNICRCAQEGTPWNRCR